MSNENKTLELIIKQLDKIDEKIDKLDERLVDVEKVGTKQEENLKEHMRRTELLELAQKSMSDKVEPLIKIHTVVWGICKIVVAVGVIVSIISGIVKLIPHL